MVNNFFKKSKKILLSQQQSTLSAASIIIAMSIASYILGFVRQRIILSYFPPQKTSLFFASFRLSDLIFEILIFGTYTSALIPILTKTLKTDGEKKAWEVSSRFLTITIVIFALFATIVGLFSNSFYKIITPGFSDLDIQKVANLSRILLDSQVIFVASYILSGTLEASKRFLIPALAPVFYNLGIVIGILFLSERFGLSGAAIAVVIGATLHFLIQLPLALKLGFRPSLSLKLTHEVKSITKLALPRIVDLSFDQVQQTIELFLASLISTASYTYFTLGTTIRLLPVSLFGGSLAKAAFSTLSEQKDEPQKFASTFLATVYQILFCVIPIATLFTVLRIPISRLFFGTKNFDWQATVETGFVIAAFSVAIVVQSVGLLLERAFYALHDTQTPVSISLITTSIIIVSEFILVQNLHLPVWSLAVSASVGITFQIIILTFLLQKRTVRLVSFKNSIPVLKIMVSSFLSGLVMYLLMKILDVAIFDTQYTINLLILTLIVALSGLITYLGICYILKLDEVTLIIKLIKNQIKIAKPKPGVEPLTPPASENLS